MQPYAATDIKKEKEPVTMIFSEMMTVQNPEKVIQGFSKKNNLFFFAFSKFYSIFRECNTHLKKCKHEWGEWGEASECPVTCGEGYRKRNRKCFSKRKLRFWSNNLTIVKPYNIDIQNIIYCPNS